MDEKRSFISLMILMAIRASKSQENSDSGGIKCGTTLSSGTFASAGSLRSYTAPWAVSIGNLDINTNLINDIMFTNSFEKYYSRQL